MDLLILLAVTGCGALGAPPVAIFLGAALLTILSSRRKFELARAYREVGIGRVLASALFLSFANNTVFSLVSFALGSAIYLLI
jgi:uncharacterized protein (TIGR03382 family)